MAVPGMWTGERRDEGGGGRVARSSCIGGWMIMDLIHRI